jgi:DNA repair protein SbcC/Rad50
MKPLRLRIENFTCFRDPVELDFEGLSLFAITGTTGAGKSSLLDAMIFALYGKVPRIGGKGLSELIALGRERMAVVFDFAVGNRHLRVARAIRRKGGAAQVQLDEVVAGGELPVCSGVMKPRIKSSSWSALLTRRSRRQSCYRKESLQIF